MAKPRAEGGFILIVVLALLLLVAATALSLNVETGLQARMATNGALDAQTTLDELAVIEQSLWKLAGNATWRVPAGEAVVYRGQTYLRKAYGPDATAHPALAAYKDVVTISVQAPAASTPVTRSFRYRIDTPFLVRKPGQTFVDGAGHCFFADMDNHCVWRIDGSTGEILRVAGTGLSGFAGDGGAATQARLDAPCGVAADGLGNLYIADTGNHCVRKVAAGVISTVVNTAAGSGSSGDGGPATAAKLSSPRGVAVDGAGNLYIADTENHRVRKVTVATGVIETVAGTTAGLDGDGGVATAAKLNRPAGCWVGAAGDLWIADTENHRVRKVTAATGLIGTVAGTTGGYDGDGGAATAAKLNKPGGVWVDAAANCYIADTGNHRIRKVAAATGLITTFAGTGAAGYTGDGGAAAAALIDAPRGVCGKATGEVVIGDTGNSCLRQVSTTGQIATLPMTAGPALSAPQGVAAWYDAAAKTLFLYIADTGSHRIRRLDTATNAVATVAGTGSAGAAGDGGAATAAQLDSPARVAVDAAGDLYIADTGNHKIRRVTLATGVITTVAGTGAAGYSGDGAAATAATLRAPRGVVVASNGDFFIADTENHRVRKVSRSNGKIGTLVGTGTAGYSGDGGNGAAAQVNGPQGLYINAAGDLYIADTENHRIRLLRNTNSIISTVAGTTAGYSGDGAAATAAELRKPTAVSIDAVGNVCIADTGNHVLRVVDVHTGTIATWAGTGSGGYDGDGQPAVQARLKSPSGAAWGLTRGGGRLYVGDTGNNRVRSLALVTAVEVYGRQ